MKKRHELLASALIVLMALVIGPVYGQYQAPADPGAEGAYGWNHSFTAYMWLTGQSGDAVVRGRPVDVDISVSDAWDAISSLDGAFLGHYEGSKRPWTIMADLFYLDLAKDAVTPLGTANLGATQAIAEIATTYEVDRQLPAPDRLRTVEILGGLRYSRIDLDLTGPVGVINVTAKQDWLDPFVGFRVKNQLSPLWSFWARADIGGFGIGDSSDFTWQLVLGSQYRLSSEWGLDMGWRWLDYDYDTGSGDTRFEYDVLLSGPFVGFQYDF